MFVHSINFLSPAPAPTPAQKVWHQRGNNHVDVKNSESVFGAKRIRASFFQDLADSLKSSESKGIKSKGLDVLDDNIIVDEEKNFLDDLWDFWVRNS